MPSKKGRNRRHAHKEKRGEIRGFSPYMSRKACETCGKQCYMSREEAKQAARVNHPGQVMHAYDCTEPSGTRWWHLSSIPAHRLKILKDSKHEEDR